MCSAALLEVTLSVAAAVFQRCFLLLAPLRVPPLLCSMLAPADKARWEAERAEALKKEQEQRQAEADAVNQKVGGEHGWGGGCCGEAEGWHGCCSLLPWG